MQSFEKSYIDLMKNICLNGDTRMDRTGVGCKSLFATRLCFSLKTLKFPLLTTKRVFFRGIVEELLWMLRGETDAKILHDRGIKIWDGNSTDPAYLARTGNLAYDIGKGYGHQLRSFGGDDDLKINGVDQLRTVLTLIKHNPTSRRIMWSYWNPLQEPKMCLPPCHYSYQFWVSNGELSCLMTQRSADLFLGVPFNIASVALLCIIIAHVATLKLGSITISMGDTHIYSTHMHACSTQILRTPLPLPTLTISKGIKHDPSVNDMIDFIESLKFEDIHLSNYEHHPAIKAPMAV